MADGTALTTLFTHRDGGASTRPLRGRCQQEDCDKAAVGTTGFCGEHGGGNRCGGVAYQLEGYISKH